MRTASDSGDAGIKFEPVDEGVAVDDAHVSPSGPPPAAQLPKMPFFGQRCGVTKKKQVSDGSTPSGSAVR